jgi:hypothetical protein
MLTTPAATIARTDNIGVAEMLSVYLDYAVGYYRKPDGKPTGEVKEIKLSIRPVRELYGAASAQEFGPLTLAAVRQHMIGQGLCRTLINKRIDRLKRQSSGQSLRNSFRQVYIRWFGHFQDCARVEPRPGPLSRPHDLNKNERPDMS